MSDKQTWAWMVRYATAKARLHDLEHKGALAECAEDQCKEAARILEIESGG